MTGRREYRDILGLKAACPEPPNPHLFKDIGKLVQILNRLITSLTAGHRWFLLNVLLLAALLTSISIFNPLGYTMRALANEFDDQVTPVLEVYVTDDHGEFIEFTNWFLNDIEEFKDQERAYSSFEFERRKLFTEENVTAVEEIEGVETVARALYCDAETTYEQYATPNYVEFHKKALVMLGEDYPEHITFLKDIWKSSGIDVPFVEYDVRVHTTYTIGLLSVEVGKIDGWSLGFNELIEGEMVKPGDALQVNANEYLLEGSGHNVDREGSVRLLIGHSIDKTDLYFRNDTSHVYDFEVVGILAQPSEGWSPGGAVYGYVNLIADLFPFIEILKNENHVRGVPLPRYTSIYVKPWTPMDLPKVEREIKRLFPETIVKRAGEAPVTISNIAKVTSERYSILSAGSILLLGAALVSTQAFEAYRSRKQMWLLHARGWSRLDFISYMLLRAAVTGIVAGIIAAGILFLAQGKVPESILLSEVMSLSPRVQNALIQVLSEFPSQATITSQPLIGVTASVITCTVALLYSVSTKPRSPILTVVAEGNIDK